MCFIIGGLDQRPILGHPKQKGKNAEVKEDLLTGAKIEFSKTLPEIYVRFRSTPCET